MVNSKQWKAWLYLAPALVLLMVFTVWPIINTVRMSLLENYSGLKAAGGATFNLGFGNFVKVVKYKRFVSCLKNTVLLCLWTVPISTLLALLIAVALNSIKFLQKALQTIFFLPYVTNSIAIGMVFAAMFNIVGSFYGTENEIVVTAGIINNIIEFFGGHRVNWINSGSTYTANMAVMVVYIVWNALPFKILILLGGLHGHQQAVLRGGQGRQHPALARVYAHHRAAAFAHAGLCHHHRLHRRLQGIHQHRGYLWRNHGPGQRAAAAEHHGRLHLRFTQQQQPGARQRRGADSVFHHSCRHPD